MAQERLQKVLAAAGVAARRKAETLIRAGQVTVNGQVITEMGYKVDANRDHILVKGRALQQEKKIYLLLNKPTGYLTTLHDPQGRPIVTDLLPTIKTRVFPVGRLDLDSSGALIMTNDGRLGHALQHPKFEVNKTYRVLVTGRILEKKLDHLRKGIFIEGYKTRPAQVRRLKQHEKTAEFEIIIHEGKKRQVRKMFAAIGHPVQHLTRTAYGRLQLEKLPTGQFRHLRQQDFKNLFSGKIPFTINTIPD